MLPSSLPEAAKNPCSQLLTQLLSHQVFTMLLMYLYPGTIAHTAVTPTLQMGFITFVLVLTIQPLLGLIAAMLFHECSSRAE